MKRITVKSVHRIQRTLVESASHEGLEVDACFGDAAALTLGFFPFVGGEGLEITVEARIAAVRPMELTVAPNQPAGVRAHCARGLIEKQSMYRGEATARGVGFDLLQKTRGGRCAIEVGTNEKARTRRGREGYGDGELRVVAPADSCVGLRPGEIKHELAVGVALDEGRCGRRQSRFIGHRNVGGVPARTGPDAVSVLEGCEELVSQERVAISSQGIPLPRVELVDAVMKARWGRCGQECFSMSSPSR